MNIIHNHNNNKRRQRDYTQTGQCLNKHIDTNKQSYKQTDQQTHLNDKLN